MVPRKQMGQLVLLKKDVHQHDIRTDRRDFEGLTVSLSFGKERQSEISGIYLLIPEITNGEKCGF